MRVKLIEAENVSKKVKDGKGEASILDGVSLSVYKGEMLAITGKSGKKALIASRKGSFPHTGAAASGGEDMRAGHGAVHVRCRVFKHGGGKICSFLQLFE